MKIYVHDGLIWRDRVESDNPAMASSKHPTQTFIDCPEADMIARANGWNYAEPFVRQYAGKTLELDPDGRIQFEGQFR